MPNTSSRLLLGFVDPDMSVNKGVNFLGKAPDNKMCFIKEPQSHHKSLEIRSVSSLHRSFLLPVSVSLNVSWDHSASYSFTSALLPVSYFLSSSIFPLNIYYPPLLIPSVTPLLFTQPLLISYHSQTHLLLSLLFQPSVLQCRTTSTAWGS